jgi:hypothetical protein
VIYGERSYGDNLSGRPDHLANRALNVLGGDSDNPNSYHQNGDQSSGHAWHQDRSAQPHSSVDGNEQENGDTQSIELPDEMSSPTQSRAWQHQSGLNGQVYAHEETNGMHYGKPKRKRNFSNRTKTGCLTCRHRKKKCDEVKPYCASHPTLVIALRVY